jgi:hypothetical protein
MRPDWVLPRLSLMREGQASRSPNREEEAVITPTAEFTHEFCGRGQKHFIACGAESG